MTTKNLLVELFVEELPPKALENMGQAFASLLAASLRLQRLLTDESVVTPYATPRRLAAHITSVLEKAGDVPSETKLMPASVAHSPSGLPTAALRKKLGKLLWSEPNAEAVDIALRQIEIRDGQVYFSATLQGMTLEQALQQGLNRALNDLPIPKVMQYQLADGWTSVEFVRPVHGLLALHGADAVNVTALGLTAGRETWGHRFLSSGAISIADADSYESQLRDVGKVIASFETRRQGIAAQLESLRLSQESDGVVCPNELLSEVTALVEWPAVYECHFDHDFLSVPEECLVLTMQTNQRYFACTLNSALINRFLIVSNIETSDPSLIIRGNERVIRPRLADAKFFFDQDRKTSLESRVVNLDKVVYHGKLGTQRERTERVRLMSRQIAERLYGLQLAQLADRAALLAKADLLTEMVGEFPELQGVMGFYYARHDGEQGDVAIAIEDHYKPRFAGDTLPRGEVGLVVALADKLETLVGMFGIGQLPTGDKDPFALRRHALGLIRMLTEKALPIDVSALVALAVPAFGSLITDPSAALLDFIYDRLAGSLRDQGYSAQEVDAVLSLRPARLSDVTARLAAVRAFAALPEAASLAAANKRVGNILKKVDGAVPADVSAVLLKEPAELALHASLGTIKPVADAASARGDHAASLLALAALREPVDAFFESVMVNADDPALRANRLGLLATLHAAMNRVADLSKLAT